MQDINYDKVLKHDVITITLKGKQYEVQEPTMGKILAFQRESEKIKDLGDVVEAAAQIKRIIRTVYTGIPEKVFDDYSPKILYRILADVTKIVRESMLPEVVSNGNVGADSSKSPKKKQTTVS